MQKLPISNTHLVALVDDEDFARVQVLSWHLSKGYVQTRIGGEFGELIKLHRFILWFPKSRIDHIDRDKLNNQKDNLRECTPSQNGANQNKTRGSSKYKGVSFYKRTGKWSAQIKYRQKLIPLGYFSTEVEAAEAYNKMAIALFSQFANLNQLT